MSQSIKFGTPVDTNVCYGCTEETGRSMTCHATCEKYIEETKQRKEKAENIRKKRHEMFAADEVIEAGKQKRRIKATIAREYMKNK